MTQATDSTVLELRRTYPASRESVFDAWTNPEVMRIWYTEVDRPSKVAFTWAWETPSASTEVGSPSLVTLEFLEADGGTTAVLTHSGLVDAKDRDPHGHSWNGCLDNLGNRVFTS